MSSLSKFLSRFSQITIQRSSSYVQHIDVDTLDIITEGNTTIAYAQIEGTDYYDTTIQYHSGLDRLVDADCSCPVGDNCKHAAALARYFYQAYLNKAGSGTQSRISAQAEQQEQKLAEAEQWLNQFKSHVMDSGILEKANSQKSQLVYVLEPDPNTQKVVIFVHKVRRNSKGEIRDASPYHSYENIINQRLKLGNIERNLFLQLHYFSKLNTAPFQYSHSLELSQVPQHILKQLVERGTAYWKSHQQQALSWTEQSYDLQCLWQHGIQPQTEKLELYLVDQNDRRLNIKDLGHIQLVLTEPLCYIDTEQHIIGTITCDYPVTMLERLFDMPELPFSVLNQFDQLSHSFNTALQLPQPQALKDLPLLKGKATPVLRFGSFTQLEQRLNSDAYRFAELEFEYPAGRIKARSLDPEFMGQHQGQRVKQKRDLNSENQCIEQLKNLIPSITWASDLDFIKRSKLKLDVIENVLCTSQQHWLNQIFPHNQLEKLGWKIEHTAQSMLNLQIGHNIQYRLDEVPQKQDWFDVGITVEDAQGNTHNLIDLIARSLQQNPQLLEADGIAQWDDEQYLNISIAADQPLLAISAKVVKPILSYLRNILEQSDSAHIDRYDASQLFDLEHHLGMQWQGAEQLKQFAQQLKHGYQSHIATPKGFQGELRPYQQQGLAWLQFLVSTQHAGILADDMGLGKTAQTLAHLLIEKHAGKLNRRPALIIAPTSLMQNWFKEAQKFTPELKVLRLQGPQRHEDFAKIPEHDIVLSTYPLLSRDEEYLSQYQYHILILDEAQHIKNPRAKAAQVARQLPSKHRLCLTGTPLENHLGELWSLFHFLMPGFLYSQDIFNKKYRYPIERNADVSARQQLVGRIQPFMLRRLKTDVAKELPPKTTIEVSVEMNDQQAKLYEAVRASMQRSIREIIAQKGFNRSQIQILDALLKLRQVCCHPSLLKLDAFKSEHTSSAKYDHLMEMLDEMLAEGRKILIFSQFTSMLQLIEDGLVARQIAYSKLTGQTKKREQAIDAFQSGQVPVFLISLKAGGVGLNLTAADTVIHFDPWWNPAAEDQASDRAWRIGQDKPVFVYKLVTDQSIEEKIILMQQAKAQLAQSVLSVDQQDQVKLSEDEVMKLLD